MTNLDIPAIRAEADAATPGPWIWKSNNSNELYRADLDLVTFGKSLPIDYTSMLISDSPRKTIVADPCWPNPQDAPLIAHCRTNVPALCDEVERLRVQYHDLNEEWREQCRELREKLEQQNQELREVLLNIKEGSYAYVAGDNYSSQIKSVETIAGKALEKHQAPTEDK